jgi:hypothetical protein
VRIAHVFNAVGNQVARREGIQHSVVAHGNSIVDGYGVEFGGKAAFASIFFFKHLAYFVQVHMAGNHLGK